MGLPLLLFSHQLRSPLSPAAHSALGVTIIVAVWWVTEAIPLAASALLPAALFPLCGVASAKEIAPSYANPFVLLLLGGFMLAMAVEHTGAHRRVALHVLLRVGLSPRRLVLGFAVTSTVLSMWISNTATALILMPVALAIVEHAAAIAGERSRGFGVAVVLAVAYGASVGGLGTPIGTPPNLMAIGALHAAFPDGPGLSFVEWMRTGVPVVVCLCGLMWAVLVFVSPRVPRALELGARELIADELRALGPWTAPERRALGLFAATAVLWITREDVVLGEGLRAPGWSTLLGLGAAPDDATVALLAVIVAFLMPNGEGRRVLTWPIASRVPWDLILLFGGGIALSLGFEKTGVSRHLGALLGRVGDGSMEGLAVIAVLGAIFVTELISNTALANLAMPILAAAATTLGGDPRLLLVPVAMACSCGFMMPAGTGPNAIAFGTGRVRVGEMVRAGFLVNLASWLVIVGVMLARSRP